MSDYPNSDGNVGDMIQIVRWKGRDFGIPILKKSGAGTDLSAYAKLDSPALTGTPTAPTAANGTSNKQIATTEFVAAAMENLVAGEIDLSSYAKLQSPNFGGIPNAPTAAPGTNSRQLATCEFVINSLGSGGNGGAAVGDAIPLEPGTASAGTSGYASRQDHKHPLPPKLANQRTITLQGDVAGSAWFDGSQNITIQTTMTGSGGVELGNTVGQPATTNGMAGTATTAARSDHSHPLQTSVTGNAGSATKLLAARTITLSGDCTGSTSFDGSGNVTISTTVAGGGIQLGSTVPKVAGTAAAGTASTAARSDHVHPLQTTVSGNAGTASRLASSRTITISGAVSGSASFDGGSNITISTTGGISLSSSTPASDASSASAGSASTAARGDHRHQYPDSVKNVYSSGGDLKFWSGPESALPSSRNNNTIYFVY